MGRGWREPLRVSVRMCPFCCGNPLLVCRESSQELLRASRFILGTAKGLRFALRWRERNKNGVRIQVAAGHQLPGSLGGGF